MEAEEGRKLTVLTLALPPWAKHESSLIQVLLEKNNRSGEATDLGSKRFFSQVFGSLHVTAQPSPRS